MDHYYISLIKKANIAISFMDNNYSRVVKFAINIFTLYNLVVDFENETGLK